MNKDIGKGLFSLTLLYAAVVFIIQSISIVMAGCAVFILARLGILASLGVSQDANIVMLKFMVISSLIVGIIITVATIRIPLGPLQRIINNMNRLAAGDFKARLTFRKPLQNHPAFAKVSDSFNVMAQELEHTEMLRSDFVNNFSHEFKTPIVSIAGFAKLLRRGNLTQEQQEEYLSIIEEESLRLAAMATNVLNLTKVENQTILAEISTYNLSEQIRSCVLLLEDRWSRKNIDWDLEFDEYEISADEELLKQVWINLLDNAIKFSPVTGEILVKIVVDDSIIKVTVTNYGIDIPKDKQDKIFNKFYQVEESHASQGNGVGLAIVKCIAQLHGGDVYVNSKNEVTSFTVELPEKIA